VPEDNVVDRQIPQSGDSKNASPASIVDVSEQTCVNAHWVPGCTVGTSSVHVTFEIGPAGRISRDLAYPYIVSNTGR